MAEKKEKKGLIAEFREFISRGNVMDLAVGMIIGSAFTAIVNSLVNDMIMPFVGYLIGGINFTDFKFTFPEIIPGVEPATICYGNFIQQVINLLIIALAVFLMVKVINVFYRKKEEPEEEPAEPAPSPELEMLTEIRDLLKEKK